MNILDLPKKLISDLAISLGLFTRIPVKSLEHSVDLGKTVWAWPLIGGFLGVIIGIFAEVLNSLPIPPEISSLIILSLLILVTGGFHEDGLADTFDGLWGGNTPEKRLEIMNDSRHGTFGVLALVVSILFRWVLLKIFFESGFLLGPLVVACVVSRAAVVPFMIILPSARTKGLSSEIGRVPFWSVGICFLISIIPIFLFLGVIGFLPVAVGLFITVPVYFVAKKLLQGQTGDVLGTIQQFSEIGILLAIVLYFTG